MFLQVVVNIEFSLQELTAACVKAFIGESLETANQNYKISVIDGKSVVSNNDELNNRRRTFGFCWEIEVKI